MTWEKFRVVPFEIKSLEEKSDRYEFSGHASIFHTKDRIKDIVRPGAFKRTMEHHDGKFPLCWMHNRETIIGGAQTHEDNKGWAVEPGYLIKGIQKAEEAYLLMKAKVVDGMSFAYRAIQKEFIHGIRHLKEVAVGEITVGPRTMIAHPDALITYVKEWELFDSLAGDLREAMVYNYKIWEDQEGWTEIRYRVRNPDLFKRIRRWPLKANSIIAIGGPLKTGEGGAVIQALRFLKSAGWTLSKAKKWVKDHAEDLKFYEATCEMSFAMADAIYDLKHSGSIERFPEL